MLGKDINVYKLADDSVVQKIKASYNCKRIDELKLIGNTEDEIRWNRSSYYYLLCTSWYLLRILDEDEVLLIITINEPKILEHSWYYLRWREEDNEKKIHRICPIFGEGDTILCGYNPKIDTLSRN